MFFAVNLFILLKGRTNISTDKNQAPESISYLTTAKTDILTHQKNKYTQFESQDNAV
jgi:hypothetical protein